MNINQSTLDALALAHFQNVCDDDDDDDVDCARWVLLVHIGRVSSSIPGVEVVAADVDSFCSTRSMSVEALCSVSSANGRGSRRSSFDEIERTVPDGKIQPNENKARGRERERERKKNPLIYR